MSVGDPGDWAGACRRGSFTKLLKF
jgi:hypothetical protein